MSEEQEWGPQYCECGAPLMIGGPTHHRPGCLLQARVDELEAQRDAIQHQEIAAAQVEYNAMRDRAVAAEAEVERLRGQLRRVLAGETEAVWEAQALTASTKEETHEG